MDDTLQLKVAYESGINPTKTRDDQENNDESGKRDIATKINEERNGLSKQVNTELYNPLDDNEINNGARAVLTFRKNMSFENAFFIIPVDKTEIRNVLSVHTSVNLLQSFIPEIVCKHLG